jgi:hypothetical protein
MKIRKNYHRIDIKFVLESFAHVREHERPSLQRGHLKNSDEAVQSVIKGNQIVVGVVEAFDANESVPVFIVVPTVAVERAHSFAFFETHDVSVGLVHAAPQKVPLPHLRSRDRKYQKEKK